MRYMGSKARHAKHIIPIMMSGHDQSKPYIEPFVGGGNMIDKVPADIRIGSDVAEYAIALLDAIAKGWVPPDTVTDDEYYRVKSKPEEYSKEYVGFAAYCCSYSGKFWGGYWRSKGRNAADEQSRHLKKQAVGLRGVKFLVSPYDQIEYPDGATVYMDPPYAGTTKYKSGGFDHDKFWHFCEDLSSRCRVFVSEYTAPDGWRCVWEKQVTNSLTKNTGAKVGVERLFTL